MAARWNSPFPRIRSGLGTKRNTGAERLRDYVYNDREKQRGYTCYRTNMGLHASRELHLSVELQAASTAE